MMRVLMLSGGIDSATVLYSSESSIDLCMSVYYGQPGHVAEIEAAPSLAASLLIPHEVATIRLGAQSSSGILGGNDETAAASVVAGRNSAFVALAAMRGATTVVLGCNGDDQEHYMDCRAHILRSVGIACGVSIELPLLQKSKKEIVIMAKAHQVPLSETVSCYRGSGCGSCAACVARSEAGA